MDSSSTVDQSLRQGLEARSAELERATVDRVLVIGEPSGTVDPEYRAGLLAAVPAALFYGISGIGANGMSVPPQLLFQARLAARHSVSLDTVIRRYFAGYALFSDFLVEEAERAGWRSGSELQHVMRVTAGLFDRLVAAVGEEYSLEAAGRSFDLDHRQFEHVRQLLAGELSDPDGLGYNLDAWHLAAIAKGPGSTGALQELAGALESRLLLVRQDERTAWAWLGSRDRPLTEDVVQLANSRWPPDSPLGLGEPGHGLPGWRLSHRQAVAAMSIAQRGADKVVRYADVSMLASALHDDVLSNSLRETYLVPLEGGRDGGAAARETLRAYLAANRNASSAAAALGVSRKTVSIRLRTAEERIGRSLERCVPELETALRLSDLTPATASPSIPD